MYAWAYVRVLNLGTGTKTRNIHVSKGKEIPFCFFSFFFCLGENNSVQFLNKIRSQLFGSWELSLQPCFFHEPGNLEAGLDFPASRDAGVARMVKATEIL